MPESYIFNNGAKGYLKIGTYQQMYIFNFLDSPDDIFKDLESKNDVIDASKIYFIYTSLTLSKFLKKRIWDLYLLPN